MEIKTKIETIERKEFDMLRRDARFITNNFTKKERAESMKRGNMELTLMGKFCAKKAIAELTGCKTSDIEILNSGKGRPYALVKGKKAGNIKCSITHSIDTSAAFIACQE